MRPFAYSTPRSLDEALTMIGEAARPIVGGTDLVTLMKADIVAPTRLVAMRTVLPRGIAQQGGDVTLGAATTLRDIEENPLLQREFRALSQSAALAASQQIRNVATLGGNVLQRPRCWYFRDARVHCWLKGGDVCQARDGDNRQHAIFIDGSPCVAVHPSDPAVALTAFDAHLRIKGPRGERIATIGEFFALPSGDRRRETTLRDDELVIAVHMPTHPHETRSIYLKTMDRGAFSFALVAVAAVLRLSDENRVGHARIVLGGVAPIPWRAHDAETILLSHEVDDDVIRRAADAAIAHATPLQHNAWKPRVARALIERALRMLVERDARRG